jgi:flagellar hook-associated protein 3 FlgL
MPERVGTQSTFMRVLLGIQRNQRASIRAQEQLSSGLRILRPSDDPTGAARSLSLLRRLADVGRFDRSIAAGRATVDTATSELQSASDLLSEAREVLVQAMNGTLTQEDRDSLAVEFDLLHAQLLEIANARSGDRYVFGGTATGAPPWREEGGRVRYFGDRESQILRVGNEVDVAINVPGSELFGRFEPTGAIYAGLTGAAPGTTADEGSGFATLRLRHDATDPGSLASVGIALLAGGASDTLLGAHDLVIDTAAGTIRLGSGPAVELPAAGDPALAHVTVANALGGELHLDLTGFTGGDFTTTVTGQGSASLDGTTFTPIDFADGDFLLRDEAAGIVLHVDATGIGRAGDELVSFGGTANLFDVLSGIAADLRNPDGLAHPELLQRLDRRLDELDRNQENVLVGLGVLGARSQRLASASERSADVELQLESLLSDVRDADFATVALDLARSEQTLQLAQASGARLLQNTLLNFLA